MKKEVIVDLRVVLEPPCGLHSWGQTGIEADQRRLRAWARELQEFIRDHRSQDPVNIRVEEVFETQCEYCEYQWEVDDDGCPVCCQQAIDEFESADKVA